MTPATLHTVGEALYGPRWQSDLARHIQISPRYMRRLATGEAPIPHNLKVRILEAAIERWNGISAALDQIT